MSLLALSLSARRRLSLLFSLRARHGLRLLRFLRLALLLGPALLGLRLTRFGLTLRLLLRFSRRAHRFGRASFGRASFFFRRLLRRAFARPRAFARLRLLLRLTRLRRLCRWCSPLRGGFVTGRRLAAVSALDMHARNPLLALAVERTRAVVLVPVGDQREADDRETDPRTVVDDHDARGADEGGKISRVYPAAIAAEADVAPAPIG